MDKLDLVDKLKDKANISYENAKIALENSNWDILDAMLYLEGRGIVEGPSVSVFYSNEYKESYDNKQEEAYSNDNINKNNSKSKDNFEGIFEAICKVIDNCNNIFFQIKKDSRVLVKIPLTVVVVLLFFAFWIIIPLVIVGLFFDIEFMLSSMRARAFSISVKKFFPARVSTIFLPSFSKRRILISFSNDAIA